MNITHSVKTAVFTTARGDLRIIAKVKGKQATIDYDATLDNQANHCAAAGAVLNKVLDSRQQAMLKHPSGGQRVFVATFAN